MKDILEKVIGLVPAYVSDLIQLVRRPKGFIGDHVSDSSGIQEPLVFLTMSFLLKWLIGPKFRADPLVELTTDVAFTFVQVLAYGGALVLAWRVVRGAAETQKVFAIHFYYSGVLLLIIAFAYMVFTGMLRTMDSDFYTEMIEAAQRGDIAGFLTANASRFALQSPASGPTVLVCFVFISLATTWILAGWGAYRNLNRLSRARSTLAFALFAMFCVPTLLVLALIANAAVGQP